jgi:hypothetical protein
MNNLFISEEEFEHRYVRQQIPYEGFIKGKGYAYFRYDSIFPTTCNTSGKMFWDLHTTTLLVQMVNTSDYMKERSWNVSLEEITKLLVRTNQGGTVTVSLGKNDAVTLSKEYGRYQIRIEDTGSEVNVHVTVADVRCENGEKKHTLASKSCRLKDFYAFFDPVGSYYSDGMDNYKPDVGSTPGWDWYDTANLGAGSLSSYFTHKGKYLKYNELWHKTKTRGVSWSFQSRWKNQGARHWRRQQAKPSQGARNIGKVLNKAGWAIAGVDIALSGELKPSHWISAGMLAASTTGVGSIVAAIWFVADFGTMGVNYLIGNGSMGLGDIIDESNFGKSITAEMYEGLY